MFAGVCSLLWVCGGVLTRGFAYSAVADESSAIGSAARVALAAACVYLLSAFAASIVLNACIGPCAEASPWDIPGIRYLQLTPEVMLGAVGVSLALVSWRVSYASFRNPW